MMQDRINLQKTVADSVLSKLELLDRYCIVAGGAPRDWYLGNVATDIDVYLYYPTSNSAKQRVQLLNELGFKINNSHENWQKSELYETNHNILYLYNCEYLNEKIQIIFVNKPTFTSVVDTFPISISKVWYKNGNIRTTEDFEYSVYYKIIWKTVDSYPETNKYIQKIKNKFSDYKYIDKVQLIIYQKLQDIKKQFIKVYRSSSEEEKQILKYNLQSWLNENL